MRMEFRSSGPSTAALRAALVRRLRFVLGRFGSRIRTATVWLGDLSPDQEDASKHCKIVLRLKSGHVVGVEDAAEDFQTAIERATDRIARSVERELARRRSSA